MSYYYSPSEIQVMREAGIISDPDKEPSYTTLSFISRQHVCSQCGGEVEYKPVHKDKRKQSDPYQFVCKKCGNTEKDSPLKNEWNKDK